MKIKLTGEKMSELFFTKVKGWKRLKDRFHYWEDLDQCCHYEIKLHESLDLQEEWLWPELRKLGITLSRFGEEGGKVECGLLVNHQSTHTGYAYRETKALAQLEAGLKALGVI